MESAPRARTIFNGKEVDYFGGCGFFELQAHPKVIEAAADAVKKYGISSVTTRTGYGTNPVLLEFEKQAALFFGTESFLYYITGCFGGTILLTGLRNDYDIVFIDSESHYSAYSAISAIKKPVIRFEHRNPNDLEQEIKSNLKPGWRPLVICDGIFPISGELSPLPDYKTILDAYDHAVMCVDDAYAVGVIGETGMGTYEYFNIHRDTFYSSGTLSKALGGHGGIIAGSPLLIEKLKTNNTISRACTPTPNASLAASAKALEILRLNPAMRSRLWANSRYVKEGLRRIGFDFQDSPVPAVCIHQKNYHADRAVDFKSLQLELFRQNIAVAYVPEGDYTSVPKGGAIRISVFSTHSDEQLGNLVETIGKYLKKNN